MRRFVIGLVITGICGGLLLRLIDWNTTADALRDANVKYIALAVTCLILSVAAKTVRWRLLLPSAAPVTMPRLYRILHISFLLNNVLPARLGDVARVAMTTRQPGMRFGHVLSSMFTERVTDSVTLIAGFVLVSPFLPLPADLVPWLHIAWLTVAGLVLLVVLIVLMRRPLARLAGHVALTRRLLASPRVKEEALSFSDGWRQLFSLDHSFRIWGWSWMAWVERSLLTTC